MTDVISEDPAAVRRVPGAVWLLVGGLAAVGGLLPWVVNGMRLPVQNLWADSPLREEMPVALLPFNQYYVDALFGMIVAAGAAAGLAARRRAPAARRQIALGTFVVLLSAVVQTLIVVCGGLRAGVESTIYVVAVTLVIAASLLVAMLTGRGIGRAGRPGAAVATAVAGVALGHWVGAFLELSPHFGEHVDAVYRIADHVPAVVAGLALAWCGWRPRGRLTAWPGAAAVLWVVPALLAAVFAVGGDRALARQPTLLAGAARDAFVLELEDGWSRVVVALVLGVVLRMAFDVLGRRRWRAVTP